MSTNNSYGDYMKLAVIALDTHTDEMKEAMEKLEPIDVFDFKISFGEHTITVPANGHSYASLRMMFIHQLREYGSNE